MKKLKLEDIKEFDILKVFHFVGSRRKKHYMYKIAVKKNEHLVAMDILELAEKGFDKAHTCRLEFLPPENTEIVHERFI